MVKELQKEIAKNKKVSIDINQEKVSTIIKHFPSKFLHSLYNGFNNNVPLYIKLELSSNDKKNPFELALAWLSYSAWLQNQVNENMFTEEFGLKEVYVPLRAYYKDKIETEDDGSSGSNRSYQSADKKIKRYVVVNLEDELQSWLDQADKSDAIRVISGGPGSGKSSFAKMFAATLAEEAKILVLFIPLHRFSVDRDLVESIDNFIENKHDIPQIANPLKRGNFVNRLLIIFDGLDELANQGEDGAEAAHNFIGRVVDKVNHFNKEDYNDEKPRLMVLICGREIVVQRNQNKFSQSRQILHTLPYFITPEDKIKNNYIDEKNLLNEDQRLIWWKRYSKAKKYPTNNPPEFLNIKELTEITVQPLLIYLLAFNYEDDEFKQQLNEKSNKNLIYEYLIIKVYNRDWSNLKAKLPKATAKEIKTINSAFKPIQDIKQQEFVEFLEGIAIAAWHSGDIRVTTLSKIQEYGDHNIVGTVISFLKGKKEEERKAIFTNLLTAFYFRQYEDVKPLEETFEFTHKSFGEYLVAIGIVRQLRLIHQKLQQNELDKKQALETWAKICGLTAMDEYIFKFIVNEIQLQKDKNNADVGAWQQTMCNLISYMLKHGMPMERLSISTFQEANRQARNAEEALLVVLNACARVTEKLSHIKWPGSDSKGKDGKENKYPDFGNWISRLRGQRVNNDDVFCLDYLSFLDLQNCILTFQDFYKANLLAANLQAANLQAANLLGAKLQAANLQAANLLAANLLAANLQAANLLAANLQEANLLAANLLAANLQEANLQEADLQRANLQEANLQEANLQEANLQEANLQEANLQEANLQRADLQWANLQGANLQGANLQGANLQGANLQGANLQRANLTGTILEGEDLSAFIWNDEDDLIADEFLSDIEDDDDFDFEEE